MRKTIIILCLLIGGKVFSQEKIDTNKIDQLDRVIVMGIRGDKKTPITQKTISKKEISQFYQGQEIPILLDKNPSITSQSDGGHVQGYTYFRIRGIDQTRINMTLNGAPLNEPEDQGVYTSNYPGFTNVIQSIQIQRGVGTSSNGVSSYGGSISFLSQSGLNKSSELDIGCGSFNTKRINFSNSTGLNKKNFALFTNISAYSSDGYRYNSGGNGYSLFISGGYYKNFNILKFTTFTGRSINQMAWLAVSENDIKHDRRTNYNKGDANDKFNQTFGQLQWTKILNKYSKFSSNIFYNRLDGSYDYFRSGKRSLFLGSNFYGIISNYSIIKKNIKFNFGISLNTYDRKHDNKDQYINKGIKNELSSFTKLSYDIQKVTFFGDAQYRYTNFKYYGDVKLNKLEWNFFNPKAGIIYTKNKFLNYYFSVGTTKREPTRTNLFSGDDNLVSLNKILPEKVIDYELGLNFKNNRLSVQSNFYYMNFHNEITPIGPMGANSLPLMINVDKSFRNGIEIDFTYKSVFDILTFYTNLNISHNKSNNKNNEFEPPYTPNFTMNQFITVNYNKLSFNINSKYQSKSYISFDNKYSIPGFVIFGSNISYEYNSYTFVLQGNNLLNNKYYTSGYVDSGIKYLYTNALSNFYFTIKKKF